MFAATELRVEGALARTCGHSPASVCDSTEEREDVWRIEVVEDAEAEDRIELAVALARKVTHVAELEVDASFELERAGGEAGFLQVCLATLDRHDIRATCGELERVHALEAGEVEHTKPFHVAEDVADELDDAAELHLVA